MSEIITTVKKVTKIRPGMKVEWRGGVYVGDVLSKRVPHGKGEIKYQNGDIYKGDWKLGSCHGNGECFGKLGEQEFSYKGEFRNDNFNGHGVYTWGNGDQYEGNWKNNKANGKGTYKWASGEFYTGFWKDNRKFGVGTYINKQEVKYDGFFVNDVKHGFGIETFLDGRYTGFWVNGKRHGEGFFQLYDDNDIVIYRQTYENGNRVYESPEKTAEVPTLKPPKELKDDFVFDDNFDDIEILEEDEADIAIMINAFLNHRKKNIPNFFSRLNRKLSDFKDRENVYRLFEKRFIGEYQISQLNKIQESYERLSKFSDSDDIEAIKEILNACGMGTNTNNLLIAKLKLKSHLRQFEYELKQIEEMKKKLNQLLTEDEYTIILKKLDARIIKSEQVYKDYLEKKKNIKQLISKSAESYDLLREILTKILEKMKKVHSRYLEAFVSDDAQFIAVERTKAESLLSKVLNELQMKLLIYSHQFSELGLDQEDLVDKLKIYEKSILDSNYADRNFMFEKITKTEEEFLKEYDEYYDVKEDPEEIFIPEEPKKEVKEEVKPQEEEVYDDLSEDEGEKGKTGGNAFDDFLDNVEAKLEKKEVKPQQEEEVYDDLSDEEPKKEAPKKEEPKKEEIKKVEEEEVYDDLSDEEPKKEAPKKEEPKKEEVKPQETKKEEEEVYDDLSDEENNKKEETKKEEIKPQETTKTEEKPEEKKTVIVKKPSVVIKKTTGSVINTNTTTDNNSPVNTTTGTTGGTQKVVVKKVVKVVKKTE